MRIVVALGGNALLERGEAPSIETQTRRVATAVAAIAPLRRAGHQVILTHGNGPQVGQLALQAASTPRTPTPLDVLDAESEGMIGYLIERELMNVLPDDLLVATMLTQVRVDPRDPAFHHPGKPIGPVYASEEAARAAGPGWQIARDGERWRRVVASPEPVDIMEARVISLLVNNDVTVICAGGGGIPVVRREDGSLAGAEAVIDKDLVSGLLAQLLRADWLVMLTDVDAVYDGFGTPDARPLARATPDELDRRSFAAGSMAPKIEAARRFVRATGQRAAIGRLDMLADIVRERAGTVVALT